MALMNEQQKLAHRLRSARYYAKHKAEHAARMQRYHASLPPGHRSAQLRQWRQANPEASKRHKRTYYYKDPARAIAATREWRQEHPEHSAAIQRRYYAVHPETVINAQHRRQAHKRTAPLNDLTAAQWREIKAAHRHQCAYCGAAPKRLTMDHITPLSKGGSHTATNILPACRSCNSRKKDGAVLCPVQPMLLTVAHAR